MSYVALSFVAFADFGSDNKVDKSMFVPLVTCYCSLHICGTAMLTGQKRKHIYTLVHILPNVNPFITAAYPPTVLARRDKNLPKNVKLLVFLSNCTRW